MPFKIHLYDVVLGTQDGLVNVLGLILGVASATMDPMTVIIAGIAGAFAEALSMGAVAFTSAETQKDMLKGKGKQKTKTRLRKNLKIRCRTQ